MILPDVNLLIYAHREDSPFFEASRAWLEDLLNGDEPFAIADVVLSGFLRVITGKSTRMDPTPIEIAIAQSHAIRTHESARMLSPSESQWDIFTRLCSQSSATGNLVPDAYIASLAIANGCELATNDRDFRRFRGLRTFNPLEP